MQKEMDRNRAIIEKDIYCSSLNHYTNVKIINECILKNFSLKLSRLDKLNDLTEKKLSNINMLNDCSAYNTFVFCFQKDIDESIPMWLIYARERSLLFEEGIKSGAIISFDFDQIKTKISKAKVVDDSELALAEKMTQDLLDREEPFVRIKDFIEVEYDDSLIDTDNFVYFQNG